MAKPLYEKMSKSRGNVVTPDEVIYGAAGVPSQGYEFRAYDGRVLDREDVQLLGVWQDRAGTGMFYTSVRTGKLPVYLCRSLEEGAVTLLVNGREVEQHPAGHVEYWAYARVNEL